MTAPLLRVENLSVRFGREAPAVVKNVSLSIGAGECLALVGESGSGKSVTARTLIGLTGVGAEVHAKAIALGSTNLLFASEKKWRSIRGKQIGFILQDALVSLDPVRTVGREIDDTLRLHTDLGPRARRGRVLELLADAGIPDPALTAGQRSGELSGGLRQRALIASAIALSPPLLIADEPTTALDVTIQAQILELLDTLRARGTAVLLITHDLAVVERVADRVAVMRAGEIVETGLTDAVLANPRHEYTRRLLLAIPWRHPRGTRLSGESPLSTSPAPAHSPDVRAEPDAASASPAPVATALEVAPPVLDVIAVSKRFRTPDGDDFQAVEAVSLTLSAGTTLGLVGESGSGKTTTARIALGLTRPDTGEVRLIGQPWSALPEAQRRGRRGLIGAIYQDPLSSFDPRWTVERILSDAITNGRSIRPSSQRERITDLLESVGLSPDLMTRRTRSLSGGQRQRVSIARAIAASPRVLICDEPVSSLDVSIQAQVLDLLDDLQASLGLAYLFISHDLGVIRHVSDRVAVMSKGRIVETGTAEQLFAAPEHPYTQRLLASALRRA
ncbi:ABC transporter ATP-binding protein [Parafrigoribacterium mesophilum]|uniref:ABC transporter ATP-binding protein n=1 Tax=Parafrigoribacterium mesophilum TaxID=433646 RepID=UPI0031FD226B